ncbi:hypothetical protein BH24ACT18_BH24ACT18_06280 [soil metagenome]|nr:antibiotic biosynthesis monooxygenase [Actinomycetota bacterium]
MVREIAVFRTHEGQAEAFVEAYRGASLHRGVEDPDSFTLIVEWDSVEAHTTPTQKPDFGESVGPYLAGQPEVRHLEAVA